MKDKKEKKQSSIKNRYEKTIVNKKLSSFQVLPSSFRPKGEISETIVKRKEK